jgi:predicted metal-dependent phosphoesterase TrpH
LRFDFHVHSTVSDGSEPPERLPELAAEAGVGLFALTDHDNTDGVAAARARGAELGVEVWGGIELSVVEDEGRRQMHVLGLGIAWDSPGLQEILGERGRFRHERAHEIVRRLARLGVELDFERIAELGGPGVLGRPHVARALVEAGVCKSTDDAFARYLRRGRAAYVPSGGLDAGGAIAAIHAAGGVAVLAHPLLSIGVDAPGGLATFVSRLVGLGLDGLETQHPSQGPSERKRIRRLVSKHGLLATGGSDFHGADRPDVKFGHGRNNNVHVQSDVYDALCQRRDEIRAGAAT